MAILSRRDHSRRELERKLAAAFPEHTDLIPSVLNRLQEQSYLCDFRFAQSYIRYRSSQGFGPARLVQELQIKGVGQSVTESAMLDLEEGDLDWRKIAEQVWEKKFGGPPSDIKEKSRQSRFLMYRGFLIEHFAYFMNNE